MRPEIHCVVAFCVIAVASVAFAGVTRPVDNLPPAVSAYSHPGLYQQYGFQYLMRNVFDHGFAGSQPPPVTGSSVLSFNSAAFEAELSSNGGITWTPLSAPSSHQVLVTLTGTVGLTRTFDTQMLSLNVQGGSLPPGVMIRESPTLASIGQTTITGNGPYQIDSFFDIFTELTFDGGQTWIPSSGSSHLVLGGTLDAAAYVLWRKNDGSPEGYNFWRSHFGQPPASGSGASANAVVPEPATFLLLIFGVAGWCLQRGRAA